MFVLFFVLVLLLYVCLLVGLLDCLMCLVVAVLCCIICIYWCVPFLTDVGCVLVCCLLFLVLL